MLNNQIRGGYFMLDFLKLVIVFLLIIVLLQRKVNLGHVMLISAVVLGLIFGIAPWEIGKTFWKAALSASTVNLIVALVLIMFLENIMRTNLLMEKILTSLRKLVRDYRVVAAFLPALIGLLPSAGGAVFSAPMVAEVSRESSLSPEKKSFINHWYRHLWEYIFPLYPGIILASEILKVPLAKLIISQTPFAIAAAILGIPVAYLGSSQLSKGMLKEEGNNKKGLLIDLLWGITPITLIIIMVLIAKLDISLALVLVVGGLLVLYRYSLSRIKELVKEAFSLNIVFMVLGVMIFKEVLLSTGAVDTLPIFFNSIGLPKELVFLLLPFIVGLITGVTQAFVAVTFPIFLGLGGGQDLTLIALAYVGGFAGVMVSPLHLCLVLTAQVLGANFWRVIRMLILPEAALIALALTIHFVRS